MKISGMQKLSLVDYDGHMATTLFTSGCNFACPFCHNAGLVTQIDQSVQISEDEIFEHLQKRKGIIDAVVISGGEPTLQLGLIDFAKKIKNLGLLIKLDTNGTNPKVIKKLVKLGLIDYIAMDIKNSPQKYQTTTAKKVNMADIMESINYIMSCGVDYEFRTTIVSELHNINDIDEMGKMIKGANKWFLQKYVDSDTCIAHGFHEIKKTDIIEMQEIAKKYVNNATLRGY